MATIFQRIIYKPYQCKILDFIRDNANSVTYSSTRISNTLGQKIGRQHTVKITTPDRELSATLIKQNNKVKSVSYCIVCEKPCSNEMCILQSGRPFAEFDNKFVSKVYDKMLNHYVAKNGLPHHQR